jgi:hypothetical protein
VLVLDTHDTTTPGSEQLGVIVELGLEDAAELFEVDEVLTSHFGKSDASGSLLVDELAKVSLATDEAEGNTLLAAKSGQVNDEFDRVDIVGDHDQLGLVLLNQSSNVVETELEVHWLLSLLGGTFASSLALSLRLESVTLLLASLRLVLGEQFKELGSCT